MSVIYWDAVDGIARLPHIQWTEQQLVYICVM